MTKMLDLPEALEAAGVNVRVLDGWDRPHEGGTYLWREDDDEPAGHMHHHTATTEYTPNRDKANGYAGVSHEGSARLAQENYGGGIPVYTIANAYPAPISSGAGDRSVLHRVQDGIEVVGRQGADTPGWYGNTHYWNTEYVLDGIGSPVDPAVWEMMLTVCRVQNELMGWTPNMHICHGHHTRRKVDLWAGQYADFDDTIINLRAQMEDGMTGNFRIGAEYREWEPITWMLFLLEGGTVDPNENSSQVTAVLPYKTNVKLVQDEDFALIAQYTEMSEFTLSKMVADGLYPLGKEVAALRMFAYGE